MIGGATSAAPYVGRTEHRAAVAAAFREPGHIVLICGEAGVGKSSLVAAERPDAVTEVIDGACLNLAGQPLPLAALEQIFFARGGWPGADGAEEDQSVEQRLRAIRTWADALAPGGSPTPTTLVVEDLHWADETTCDFLVYLAATARRRGLSLVITLRNDEAPKVPRVPQAVAELSRLPGAVSLELERLDRDETRELVRLLTGDDADADVCYEQSQGNPYLLGELVKDPGSRRARDHLFARVRGLGTDAAEVIGLAAVFGLWVADADLHQASGLAPDRYAAALRAALDAGVLVLDGTDYAFRHALTCEAVLSQLLPIERRLLHERAARTLADKAADDVVTAAAVSMHWDAAGVPDQAADWSLRAARKARRLNAFAEAWAHYRQALAFARRLPEGAGWLDLASEAAGAARLAGDPAAAAEVLETALAANPAEGAGRSCVLERLGCYLWEAGEPGRSAAAYREAAELLGPEVTGVHATVWAAMARGAFIMADFDQAIGHAERAVEAAREHDARAVLADALITLGTAQIIRDGDAAGLDVLRDGVRLARDVDDRAVLCRGYSNLIIAHEFAGQPAEAVAMALEGLRLLPEYGLELSVGAALACNAVNMLIRRGQYARCEELLAQLLDGRVIRGQALHLHIERAELHLRTGNLPAARAALEAAAPLRDADEPAVIAALATAMAELLASEGDADGCYRTVDEALRRLAGTQDRVFRNELLLIGLRAEADRSAPVPGRTDALAEARLRRLGDELDDLATVPGEDAEHDPFYRAARNQLGRIRGDVSADDWAETAALWRGLERPREEAYALLRQAECLAADKQRDKASAVATAARDIAERIGARPVVEEIDQLLARTRLSPAPAPRAPVEDRPYGLTEREYEVLTLLGTGATNRQIARRLFISERTVGVHVSRVLHKLQVTNRAQAAAVAARVAR